MTESNASRIPDRDAAESLATPAACPQWFSPDRPPPSRVFRAHELVAQWLIAASGGTPEPYAHKEARWLRLPFATQAAWIRPTYAALTSCDFARIRLPWSR